MNHPVSGDPDGVRYWGGGKRLKRLTERNSCIGLSLANENVWEKLPHPKCGHPLLIIEHLHVLPTVSESPGVLVPPLGEVVNDRAYCDGTADDNALAQRAYISDMTCRCERRKDWRDRLCMFCKFDLGKG